MNYREYKYGFIYIWRDRANNRYYIGSHWGHEDDNYICSSRWMKSAYKNRPTDFKRRIIERIYSCREDLYKAEQKWIDFIKTEEIKIKYFNLSKIVRPHWTSSENSKSIGEKISAKNKGRRLFNGNMETQAKLISEGKKRSFEKRIIETGSAISDQHRSNLSKSHTGKSQTLQQIEKKKASLKQAWADGRHTGMRGINHTEESKRKQSQSIRGRKLKPDQIEFLRINNSKSYKIVYKDGSTEIINGLKKYSTDRNIPYVSLFKASQHKTALPKYNILSVSLII